MIHRLEKNLQLGRLQLQRIFWYIHLNRIASENLVSNMFRILLDAFQVTFKVFTTTGCTTGSAIGFTGSSPNIPHIAVHYYIFCLVKLYQFCSCKSFALLHKVLLRWTFQDFSFFSIFRPCVRLWLYLYGSKTSQFR